MAVHCNRGCGRSWPRDPVQEVACPVCGDPQPPRLSRANAIVSTTPVSVIALIDTAAVAVPASVTGIDGASHWLDRNFPNAGTVAFYRAERIADHPTLVCGGIYAPVSELAFLTPRGAS